MVILTFIVCGAGFLFLCAFAWIVEKVLGLGPKA